ncbi:unnamed protein product [Cyprideis torosa]|uniref:Uncharacterized protein n=1 Tax=Cyprideis torosa TaxID=163714 RepID=A0A7R8ZMM6_9CRUS|nr:unnamed protein product [Cyprideis torosa]CAG0895863.1 unnamed protein product [Cyprideis torosa]
MLRARDPQQDQDPTNLYIANLPPAMREADLTSLLESCGFGNVVSTRILRDPTSGNSKGVGFARMESKDVCENIIQKLNNTTPTGDFQGPIMVKFADGGGRRKQHQMNAMKATVQFGQEHQRSWRADGDVNQPPFTLDGLNHASLACTGLANGQLIPSVIRLPASAGPHQHQTSQPTAYPTQYWHTAANNMANPYYPQIQAPPMPQYVEAVDPNSLPYLVSHMQALSMGQPPQPTPYVINAPYHFPYAPGGVVPPMAGPMQPNGAPTGHEDGIPATMAEDHTSAHTHAALSAAGYIPQPQVAK